MKKLFLSVIGMYLMILSVYSQSTSTDTGYKKRKLKFEEANLVNSYYHQNGDNAAVTGGIGSEKLTDISNSIDVKFSKYDRKNRKHSFIGEIGIDHYTSASSDKVDPNTVSSASYSDTRLYPSVNWTMENEAKGQTVGAGLSLSNEFDYFSTGINFLFSKKTRDRNGEFTAKFNAYFDQVTLILPIELRTGGGGGDDYATDNRNTFSGSISWAQVVNKNFQVSLEGQMVYQNGYLALPFHRVYFLDNSVRVENLPGSRLKIPVGLRANYFVGDKLILRSWYRFYHDDWGINSNTLQLETAIKFTPFLSVTPFYRYYQQTATDYFQPYRDHKLTDQYYTSNYDLSDFNSHFYGAGFRLAPPSGIFKNPHFSSIDIRYGHYTRTTGLSSNIVSLALGFK